MLITLSGTQKHLHRIAITISIVCIAFFFFFFPMSWHVNHVISSSQYSVRKYSQVCI